MKKHLLIPFIILLVVHTDLIAQKKPIVLTLEDVIAIAKNQSPDVMIAKHRFLSSYWQYRSFKATYLPSISFSGTIPNITRSIRKIETTDGDIFSSYANNSYSANISMSQKIGITGGNLSLNTTLSRSDNLASGQESINYSSTPISIRYNQPIFQFNSFKWERKTEPIKYEKAKRVYLEALEDISIKATRFFFNLFTAKIKKEIDRSNLENYEELLRIAKGRYNIGKIAENELLQIELQYLQNKTSITNSELEYENELFRFKSFLRLNADDEVVLKHNSYIEFFDIDFEQALELAKSNTSKAIDMDLKEIETEKSLEQAKMEKHPDINLAVNYGLSNSAEKLDLLYQDPSISKGLSVSLSLPLLDWGQRKGRFKMAESNYQMSKMNEEQARIDFEQDIKLRVIQFSQLETKMLMAAKSDTIAQKNYELTKHRYTVGKINDVQKLKEAQISFDNAKINYYKSIQTYWTELFELRKLTLYDFKRNQKISTDYDTLL